MNMKSRKNRITWMLGVALLVGTTAAAVWVTQYPRDVEAGPNDALAKEKNSAGQGVFCHGLVDVESGLLQLAPLQPGAVTEVICTEGQKVRKGEVLLRVQEEPFLAKLAEAETGVKKALTLLDQAKLLLDIYAQGIKQQEQSVVVAKTKMAGFDLQLREAERLRATNHYGQPTVAEIDNFKLQLEGGKAGVNAEEAKLTSIRNATPDPKIQEAEVGVQLQRDQLRQAQEALSRCTLRAPQDGTVLRVVATVGSQFSPASTQPAINFAPAGGLIVRAEVEQEFHNRVTLGVAATIIDESAPGQVWHGKVKYMNEAFLPPRNNFGPDFLSAGNNSRVREVIVTIDPSENMPKLGQKMRVNIGGSAAGR